MAGVTSQQVPFFPLVVGPMLSLSFSERTTNHPLFSWATVKALKLASSSSFYLCPLRTSHSLLISWLLLFAVSHMLIFFMLLGHINFLSLRL